MEAAARFLLNEPETKIFQVARKTGFISVRHFNGVFKKYYGIAPRNYQKKCVYTCPK
jgi:transcriptional regulator GlxA family with amidase domain